MAHQEIKNIGMTKDIQRVPQDARDRARLRCRAADAAARLDRAMPPTLDDLAAIAGPWLESLAMPATYAGFAIVCLNNAFWAEAFASVPPKRRLLLLPHCLAHPDACEASVNAMGLICAGCGNCAISSIQREAEAMGYQVVIAEGTSQLLDRLTSGMADAILGVACMDSLSKSYPKLAEFGVPNLAVPLVRDGCRNTGTDLDYLMELMRLTGGDARGTTRSYLPLLRQTRLIFEPPLFDCLVEGIVPLGAALSAVLGETDRIALDCLRHGGKRLRPFAVLAACVVGRVGDEAMSPSADWSALIGPAQQRVGIAIEALHRASLVHDDIEDDDDFRHGAPTLHRQYGVPAAINLGDHLVGLGYSLIASQKEHLGADAVADMLAMLARSHLELARGQGAELFWQARPQERCTPADALKLYTLKTSPAFEAAIYCGLRMADAKFDLEALRSYSTYLGTAFQIVNDLDDWKADESNKCLRGRDALAGRPTLLHALAVESAGPDEIARVLSAKSHMPADAWLTDLEALYREHDVFNRAKRLLTRMAKLSGRAAEQVGGEPVARLLQSLVRLSVPAGARES